MPALTGLSCKSNAVVLTAFCSSPVKRARLSVKVSAMRNSMGLNLEDLHHFVTKVIDDFYGDPPTRRYGKGARGVAVQTRPSVWVDLSLQGRLQGTVGIVG